MNIQYIVESLVFKDKFSSLLNRKLSVEGRPYNMLYHKYINKSNFIVSEEIKNDKK